MGFFSNTLVKNITIGSNVKFLNNSMYNAFADCRNFNSPVNIPNGITNLANTFRSCISFNQPVNIPSGVTNMVYTFNSCTNFNQPVNIPSGVTNMAYAISGCSNFNQPVNIPDKVTNMAYCFAYSNNFGHPITIGNGVTNISSAFYYCNRALNITIQSKVVNNCYGFLSSKNNSRRVNIFVPNGSTTNKTIANNMALVSAYTNWAKATNYYYNTAYNVYIYYNYF